MTLGILVNWFAAALLAFTIFFYVVIYTMWLKRSTAQNIVIGGAAGSLPPVVGWAAATGSLAIEPLLLFAIIFLWTPPHFWALSLYRTDDFVRAKLPMLPVVAGPDATRLQILLYTIVLVAVRYCAVAARLLRPGLWHCRGGRGRSDAHLRRSGLSAPRGSCRRGGCAKPFLLLDRLFVCAVCDAADRCAGAAGACVWPASMIIAMDKKDEPDGIVLTEQQRRSRRQRSIAIAVILVALVVLFFVVTLVKGPAVLNRPM